MFLVHADMAQHFLTIRYSTFEFLQENSQPYVLLCLLLVWFGSAKVGNACDAALLIVTLMVVRI